MAIDLRYHNILYDIRIIKMIGLLNKKSIPVNRLMSATLDCECHL